MPAHMNNVFPFHFPQLYQALFFYSLCTASMSIIEKCGLPEFNYAKPVHYG